MKLDKFVVIMLSLMCLYGVYLCVFCGWEFVFVPVIYFSLAYGMYKRSKVARYVTLVVLLFHLLINISTIGFVYYPVSAEDLSSADQIFELEFDGARFLVEIIPPTIIAAVVFVVLLLPKFVRGYR